MTRLIPWVLVAVMLSGCKVAHAVETTSVLYQDKVRSSYKSVEENTVNTGNVEVVLQVIAAESANQSDFGMYLVARVIVNRARAKGWSLERVVRQPYQFSALNDKKWLFKWLRTHFDDKTRKRASKALSDALSKDGYSRIRHYHTVDVHPYWARGHKPVIREGSHLFYEGIR